MGYLAKMRARSSVLVECDLCGSRGPFFILATGGSSNDAFLEQIGVREKPRTVLCKACGWIFKPLVFSADQLDQLYTAVGGGNTYSDVDRIHVAAKAERLFLHIGRFLVNRIPLLPVLDIGGGVGQASLGFANNGYEVDVSDIVSGSLLHPRMHAHKGQIDSIPSSSQYGVVILSHVLEHVWNPKKVLTRAYELLAPGGAIYVEVPFELVTPMLLRKTGDIAHVGYFARRTLELFLDYAGFSNVAISLSLESYGSRKVVVFKALGRKDNMSHKREIRTLPLHVGWLHLIYDLLSVQQIALTVSSKLK